MPLFRFHFAIMIKKQSDKKQFRGEGASSAYSSRLESTIAEKLRQEQNELITPFV